VNKLYRDFGAVISGMYEYSSSADPITETPDDDDVAVWFNAIDLKNRKLVNWQCRKHWSPKGYLKIVDTGIYCLYDSNWNLLCGYSGYVPRFFPGEHCGDYVIMTVSQDGAIVNWDKPLDDPQQWVDFIQVC